MRLPLVALTLNLLIGAVLGNTETKLLRTQSKAYPQCASGESPYRISLKGTNYAKKTFQVQPNKLKNSEFKPTVIDIDDIQCGESYLVKISWSALYPVSIEHEVITVVSNGKHESIDSGHYNADTCFRYFIEVAVSNDSYPLLSASAEVPINVTVVNTKFNIPVDLLGTLIYIIALMVGIVLLDKKFNLYRMLAT
ncbi:hypothetical protein HG535_0G00600 [Zygotorulaspora mrakii]|uniref:Uncharacterized protein n=1 Tax=Zygotorulaspora mrakii TaxID=42260 RepID=A0A7H9B750_ZYGMR|nr:uncharacterized protein HG535_0G00600 [Zygotorulaspora mrakii]QLG74176.1 hypothetical protein HG535_0G00600 [Zygotorulaspora mrakii]